MRKLTLLLSCIALVTALKAQGPVVQFCSSTASPIVLPSTAALTPVHTSFTLRNDVSGSNLGCTFTVGDNPLTVTHLGRWKHNGNTLPHEVRLIDAANNLLASVTVDPATGLSGEFIYAACPEVVLQPNTRYWLYNIENSDYTADDQTTINYNPSVLKNLSSTYDPSGGQIHQMNQTYGPLNFKYR